MRRERGIGAAQGLEHGVEVLDALATAAPGLIVAVVVQHWGVFR